MFSVVIPLYNKAKYIKFALNSVLNQTFVEFEIVVVNDGSTDNGVQIIEKEFSDFRITIINQVNQGVSAARNKGIQLAKYDYIAFLDGDDYWEPTYLEENYKAILAHHNPVMIGCVYEVVNEHRLVNLTNSAKGKSYIVRDYFKTAHQSAKFSSSSTIIKKEVLKSLGGFNANIVHGEDIDMWFRIMMLNKEAVFIPVRLAYYYLGDPNQAMFTLPSLEKHLVGNIWAMYSARLENGKIAYLDVFLEKYLLKNLRPYYVDDNYRNEVEAILKKIGKWHLPFGLFYLIPRSVAKFIYSFAKKIK